MQKLCFYNAKALILQPKSYAFTMLKLCFCPPKAMLYENEEKAIADYQQVTKKRESRICHLFYVS